MRLEDAAAQLCARCGACCSGALDTFVRLTSEEALGTALRTQVKTIGGRPYLPLACAFHDASGCRVYADRPATCRRFECDALAQVRAGGPLEPAFSRVDAVRQSAESLFRLLVDRGWAEPGESGPAAWERFVRRAHIESDPSFRRTFAELLLASASHIALVRRHLLRNYQPRFVQLPLIPTR